MLTTTPTPVAALFTQARDSLAQLELKLAALQAQLAAKTSLLTQLSSSSTPLATFTRATTNQSLPIAARMRAVFHLRTLNSDEAALALIPALQVKTDSVLLRHEICFCLGQMARRIVVPDLLAILDDSNDDVIVRHEAGEALGAIGDPSSVAMLEKWSRQGPIEVQETCLIALDKFRTSCAAPSDFHTIDPAPAAPKTLTTLQLQHMLMDTQATLFDRYRAMFALRNRGDEAAVLALTTGFADKSALFRHEVAYVLGQLAHAASRRALAGVLQNEGEHEMVRHEAAESLGAIGDAQSLELLARYQFNAPRIVTESCDVALDAAEYWAEFGGNN